jgi:hypothetical protein
MRAMAPSPASSRAAPALLVLGLSLMASPEARAQAEAQFERTPTTMRTGSPKRERTVGTIAECAQYCLGRAWCAAFTRDVHRASCYYYEDPGQPTTQANYTVDYFVRRRTDAERSSARVAPDLSGQWETIRREKLDFRVSTSGGRGPSYHVQVSADSASKPAWRVLTAVVVAPVRAGDAWKLELDTDGHPVQPTPGMLVTSTRKTMVGLIASDGQTITVDGTPWRRVGAPGTLTLPAPGTFAFDLALEGASLTTVTLSRTEGPPACEARCKAHGKCAGFVLRGPSCALLAAVERPASAAGVVSWINPVQPDLRAPPPLPSPGAVAGGVKLQGAVLRSVQVRRGEPRCQQLCVGEQACKAYSESERVPAQGELYFECQLLSGVQAAAWDEDWQAWIKPGGAAPRPGAAVGGTALVGELISELSVGLDADACDAACARDRTCVGRSWHRSQRGECRLYREVTGAEPLADWSSATPAGPEVPGYDVLMQATALLGAGLREVAPTSLRECNRTCQADEACRGLTFEEKTQTCQHLKKLDTTARRNGWVALVRDPADLSRLAGKLVSIRVRAGCETRKKPCDQHLSFAGTELALFPAGKDLGLVPWRLVAVPGHKDEFYLQNRWRCEDGDPRCQWSASLKQDRATLAAPGAAGGLIPWKLVPVPDQPEHYYLRNRGGCAANDARCDRYLSFSGTDVVLSPGEATPWRVQLWPRPTAVARTKVERRKFLHPFTGAVVEGPVTVRFEASGEELPTYTVVGDVEVAAVRPGDGAAAILADEGFQGSTQQWTNNQVPYEIAPDHPNADNIKKAIALWNSRVNVQFVPREEAHTNWVEFVELDPSTGPANMQGRSRVGRRGGEGRQEIEILSTAKVSTSLHEMGHAVGLRHEMASPLRADYITVHDDRMDASCVSEYAQVTGTTHGGCGFDAASMMMYSPRACMNDKKEPVYELKEDALTDDMVERWNERWVDKDETAAMSPCDIAGLNELYPGDPPTAGPPECTSPADCGGGACSRPEVGTNQMVCCPSGKDALTWAYFYCTELENGKACWTNGQCASGNCDHQTWNKKGTCQP